MAAPEDDRFEHYRRTRDPQALAEVFDHTALELLQLAMHLVGDPTAAEDLVQATFLSAIESAHRFRPGTPVMPWLVGILTNHARLMRRKARRVVEPDQMAERTAPDPVGHAEARERADVVTRAMQTIPPLYREVLRLRFEQGLSTVAIALRLRRAPGTVRNQLWRGFEFLRKALPRGAAPALVVPWPRGFSALRGEVLAAAAAPPAKVLVLGAVIGGLLVMNKLVVASIVAGVLGVATWLAWPEAAVSVAPMASSQPAATGVVATPPPQSEPATRTAVESRPEPHAKTVAEHADEKPEFDERPTLVAPYVVRILAVDADRAPVPAATVLLLDTRKRGVMPGERSSQPNLYVQGRMPPGTPLLEGQTDASGRFSLTTDRERAILSVARRGVGDSGDVNVSPERAEAGRELLVQLEPPVALHGRVLRGDNQPAAGVEVRGHVSGGRVSEERSGRAPDPVRTDPAGRFAMDVDPWVSLLHLSAHDGERKSLELSLRLPDDLAREITLRFPGLYRLQGTLAAPDGRPVGGQIVLVERTEQRPRGHEWFRLSAKADEQGSFTLDLAKQGTYLVVGSAAGFANSAVLEVRVDEAAPKAEVVLRLFPETRLSGRVTWEDGRPVPGAQMTLAPDVPADPFGGPLQLHEQYGRVAPATTGADGSFELQSVHPEVEYRLSCTPVPSHHRIAATRRGIRASSSPVHFVLRADEVQSSVLAGQLLGPDGTPIPRFKVALTETSTISGRLHWRTEQAREVDDAQGRFELRGLPRGAEYSLEVSRPKGLSFVRGPWKLDQERVEVTLHAPGMGAVRVLVVDREGRPVPQVSVGIYPVDPRALGGSFMMPTRADEQGVWLRKDLPEGRFFVTAPAGQKDAVKQEVEVMRDRTAEVRVTLP